MFWYVSRLCHVFHMVDMFLLLLNKSILYRSFDKFLVIYHWLSFIYSLTHTQTQVSLSLFTTAELLYRRQTFHEDRWRRAAAAPGRPEWWLPRLVIWGLYHRPCRCAPSRDSRRSPRSAKNIIIIYVISEAFTGNKTTKLIKSLRHTYMGF